MRKLAILSFAVLLTFSTLVISQTIQESDPDSEFVKAKYLKADLAKFLQHNITYPAEALKKESQGDVIISFVIKKDGTLDSLDLISSPGLSLSTSTIVAFSALGEQWSASKINEDPIDKKYLIIFRYRFYMESVPTTAESKAVKFFEKEKYDKSLSFYDKAIKDNKYDYELFESRSKVKTILGDIDGSKQDIVTSTTLNNEIMSVINIIALGKTTVRNN